MVIPRLRTFKSLAETSIGITWSVLCTSTLAASTVCAGWISSSRLPFLLTKTLSCHDYVLDTISWYCCCSKPDLALYKIAAILPQNSFLEFWLQSSLAWFLSFEDLTSTCDFWRLPLTLILSLVFTLSLSLSRPLALFRPHCSSLWLQCGATWGLSEASSFSSSSSCSWWSSPTAGTRTGKDPLSASAR